MLILYVERTTEHAAKHVNRLTITRYRAQLAMRDRFPVMVRGYLDPPKEGCGQANRLISFPRCNVVYRAQLGVATNKKSTALSE
jgi:hypothetical protein